MSKVHLLKNTIQHYDWGGFSFIPQLIGEEKNDSIPAAELWMGTHHKGPSLLIQKNEDAIQLDQYIATKPTQILGNSTAEKFQNKLPFLFKVLDVRKMLSIQAHPTKKNAEIGFARENEAGIDIKAFNRNYRDDNHKPEIMVALTDFWLLHGFKSWQDIQQSFQQTPEFTVLTKRPEKSTRELYEYLMRLPQAEVDALLSPLKKRLSNAADLKKDQADYWAERAFRHFAREDGTLDRGIFSIYMLNLVRIAPGQGIFQDAGIIHAYLEGVNIELMANSDNVFRGGLTVKHVDVDELMQHLSFDTVTPDILSGERQGNETFYPAPIDDFLLSKIQLDQQEKYTTDEQTASIYLVLQGSVQTNEDQLFSKGQTFFVEAGTHLQLDSKDATIIYKASSK